VRVLCVWEVIRLTAELMKNEVSQDLVPLRDDDITHSMCSGDSGRGRGWQRGGGREGKVVGRRGVEHSED
jgi:hypothetical protein